MITLILFYSDVKVEQQGKLWKTSYSKSVIQNDKERFTSLWHFVHKRSLQWVNDSKSVMQLLIILSFGTGFIVSYSWRGLKMGKFPLHNTDRHHCMTATYWRSNVLNRTLNWPSYHYSVTILLAGGRASGFSSKKLWARNIHSSCF